MAKQQNLDSNQMMAILIVLYGCVGYQQLVVAILSSRHSKATYVHLFKRLLQFSLIFLKMEIAIVQNKTAMLQVRRVVVNQIWR